MTILWIGKVRSHTGNARFIGYSDTGLLDAAKHLGRKDVLAILSNQPTTSDRDILDFYGDGAHASIEDTSAQHYMQLGTFLLAHAKDLLSLRNSP